jgi:hypothetical protein
VAPSVTLYSELLVVAVFMAIPSANSDDGKVLVELVDYVGNSIDVDATKFLPDENLTADRN